MTACTYIKVNGQEVAREQFHGRNEKKVSRDASHWLCNMEFNVRATLKAAGIKSAVIVIGSDNIIIEHRWEDTGDRFGYMFAGTIIG